MGDLGILENMASYVTQAVGRSKKIKYNFYLEQSYFIFRCLKLGMASKRHEALGM